MWNREMVIGVASIPIAGGVAGVLAYCGHTKLGLILSLILLIGGIVFLIYGLRKSGNKKEGEIKTELARLTTRYDLIKGEIEHHVSDGHNSFYPEDDGSALKQLSKYGIVKLEQRLTSTASFPLDCGYWVLTDKGNKEALKLEKDKV